VLSDDTPETMSTREAADALGVSARHLRRLIADGDLEGIPAGPRSGLLPTRRGVERRLANANAQRAEPQRSTPAPSESTDDRFCAPEATDADDVTEIREAEAPVTPAGTAHGPVMPAPPVPTPKRRSRWQHVARAAARVHAGMMRQMRRGWRATRRHPACSARVIIGGGLVAALLLIGATRERAATASRPGGQMHVVVTRGVHDGHPARLTCTVRSGRTIHVQVRRGRRPRCDARHGR
jgi:excisionase family DNA binding protein